MSSLEDRGISEFLSLVEYDWCQINASITLHAPRSFEGDDDYVPVGGTGVTTCGRKGRLGIPGILSRMGAMRCRQCCKALGYPDGKGSPKNDAACKAVLRARTGA